MEEQNPDIIVFAIESICDVLKRIKEQDEFIAAIQMIDIGFGCRLTQVANEVDKSITNRKAH